MDYVVGLLTDPAAWAALGMLIAMEVVLGIDNLIFISILTNKLPEAQRERARRIGIGAALLLRLGLLSTVFIIVQLTVPVITIFGQGLSWRDMILIARGLFLVWKATKEIHHNVDPDAGTHGREPLKTLTRYRRVGQEVHFGSLYRVARGVGAVVSCGDSLFIAGLSDGVRTYGAA